MNQKLPSKKIKYGPLERYLVAITGVAFATGLLWLFKHILEKAHMGLVYLLVVASVAGIAGTRPALLTAILGFLSWNFFFLHPLYTFIIHDSRDWILLFAFLIIGIMIGQITGQMRAREEEALSREKDTEALYRAILSINSQTKPEKILQELVDQVILNTMAAGCAILSFKDGELNILIQSGEVKSIEEKDTIVIARKAMEEVKAVGITQPPSFITSENSLWPTSVSHSSILPGALRFDVFLPMYAGQLPVGLMYVVPPSARPFSISNCRMLIAFASNAATLLERQRLLEETAQAETLRETERLKSVLFSSLSHNLKTPLSSLTATLSSLRERDVQWTQDTLQEQLTFMEEDIERLTENIEKLLDLAKLESGSWQPHKEWFELREIVSTAVERLPERQYKRLRIEIPDDLPLIWVDSPQISQVIRHLVENAMDYSPEDSPVIINSSFDKETVKFWIDDMGPGIDPEEREKIFRKFYRGKVAREKSIRGTGLGLSICQEILQAHGGNISVETSPEKGARFFVTLPVTKQDKN